MDLLAKAEALGLGQELLGICLCSRFVHDWLLRADAAAQILLESILVVRKPELPQAITSSELSTREFDAALRAFRHSELARIAWRDISGRAPLEETLADTSRLAELCIQAAVQHHTPKLIAEHGEPRNAAGEPQELLVFALGKLGGQELNFSSDVDLVFAYVDAGSTQHPTGSLDNQDFFTRLTRKVIHSLHTTTEQGFVFRVDVRLRPFGDSGPLVMSLAAAEHYYLNHARDWERYALIKARLVAGSSAGEQRFQQVLLPFIYRRYLDFDALQALREMKAGINAEVQRKGLRDDVKRGPGGIREIEFIVQCLQLIRGGRERSLQTRHFHVALTAAADLGLLAPDEVARLLGAYTYLRHTEHRLQQVNDRQTQRLPRDEINRARLAYALGYPDWTHFEAALRAIREDVADSFARLLSGPELSAREAGQERLSRLWSTGDEISLAALINETGHEASPRVLAALQQLHANAHAARLPQPTRERVAQLLPRLMRETATSRKPVETLLRALTLVETILGRSSYLALLIEHPSALRELVRLYAASPWLAAQITQQPLLLDDLLHPARLYAPPSASVLASELTTRMANIDGGDVEAQMNALREFRHSQVLRVAAADLTGSLPLAEVSNHLTAIAEQVVHAACHAASAHLQARHGLSPGVTTESRELPLAVLAYGKLGGMELSYQSDLDVVFLYPGLPGNSSGPAVLDGPSYFNRLGQRVIHYLTTLTPAGRAYEVDARLRPNGASGLLVSSWASYASYQRDKAWTWEHQALVRARCIAGPRQLAEDFAALRREILMRERDHGALRAEVMDMRRRMLRERDHSDPRHFDLKVGPGGITDIEFLVQYLVLKHAARHPELCEFPDNLRCLRLLGTHGILAEELVESLVQAYFVYRGEVHRSALLQTPLLVTAGPLQTTREAVQRAWEAVFGEPLV